VRIIDADKVEVRYRGGFHDDYVAEYDSFMDAPTIKTKQVKYYDDDEKAWKIGEVIVNTLHDITDSYKGSEYNGNIKD
jgi:hypothetical protein